MLGSDSQQYEVDAEVLQCLDAFIFEDAVRDVEFIGIPEMISTYARSRVLDSGTSQHTQPERRAVKRLQIVGASPTSRQETGRSLQSSDGLAPGFRCNSRSWFSQTFAQLLDEISNSPDVLE